MSVSQNENLALAPQRQLSTSRTNLRKQIQILSFNFDKRVLHLLSLAVNLIHRSIHHVQVPNIFLAQTPYNGAPVQNPVPDQTQAAFAPNPMNQYPANPAPFQAGDPNMGMNAVAKNTIPDNTQVC